MRPRGQSNFCSKAYLQGYTWDTISEQAVGTLLNAFTPVLKYTYNCYRANWYYDPTCSISHHQISLYNLFDRRKEAYETVVNTHGQCTN